MNETWRKLDIDEISPRKRVQKTAIPKIIYTNTIMRNNIHLQHWCKIYKLELQKTQWTSTSTDTCLTHCKREETLFFSIEKIKETPVFVMHFCNTTACWKILTGKAHPQIKLKRLGKNKCEDMVNWWIKSTIYKRVWCSKNFSKNKVVRGTTLVFLLILK